MFHSIKSTFCLSHEQNGHPNICGFHNEDFVSYILKSNFVDIISFRSIEGRFVNQ